MAGVDADLILAEHRVRVLADGPDLLSSVLSMLVPPCSDSPAGDATTEWLVEVRVEEAGLARLPELGHPALSWEDSGMRLTILDTLEGVVRLAARYRASSGTALLTVDRPGHRTTVLIPGEDLVSRRWADWVVRAFFGPRLLADGWVLLHAAAVRVTHDGGDRAVVILAGPRGGKSTIAHRACAELGAGFMADDLVLLKVGDRGSAQVIGWPTRVCVPTELLDQSLFDALPDHSVARIEVSAQGRRRLVLSPPDYQSLLGVTRAQPGPVALGGFLTLLPEASGRRSAWEWCRALTAEQLAMAVAEAGAVPAQRLRTLDLLGVAGDPATTVNGIRQKDPVWWADALAGVPAVGIELADVSALARLPIRDILRSRFPWFVEAA
jgi:hypothetical protein